VKRSRSLGRLLRQPPGPRRTAGAAAWRSWRSEIDAANALQLLQQVGERMSGRLAARLARELDVDDERRRLQRFARTLRGRWPSEEELLRWTRS